MNENHFPSIANIASYVQNIETPCLFLSLQEIKNNFCNLSNALPNVSFYYAVKANPNEHVINTLYSVGCKFDISTNTEIDTIKKCNVSPSDCIHTHPIKSIAEIEYAISSGIKIFTIDNTVELEKLKPYADKIELCIRLSIHNEDCRINLSEKFGVTPSEAPRLILAAHQQGFEITTLSFHVGSQNENPLKYIEALKQCQKVEEAISATNIAIKCIDIGGGFPVQYGGDVVEIDDYCNPIKNYITKYFSKKNILAEPGRYFVASSMCLLAKVKGTSIRQGKPWYYIDDSIYHSFSGKTYDYCDFPMEHNAQGAEVESTIAGATCDSYDIIKRDILLPALAVGDYLLFKQMGAYCSASASYFNGYSPTRIQVIT